jgi:hypothetical protein
MAENSIRECGTFGYKIDQTSTGIIEILNVSSLVQETIETLDPRWTAGVSFFLESLRLTVYLPSFPSAAYPATRTSDNAATKAIKLMEIEANYPKTGMKILRKKDGETNWMNLATVTLQNRGREAQIPLIIPYLTVNQIKILSKNDNLAIELVDFGDGVVGGGSIIQNRPLDFLQIEGEWRMDLDITYRGRRPNAKVQSNELISSVASQILLPNNSRAYFEFQNVGDETLYYGFSADFLKFKLEPGQLYHPGNPEGYVPNDGVWAMTQSASTEVSIVEWIYV